MDIKALFSKELRKERSIQKACQKAGNSKIKPDDRRPALYLLRDDGSDAAIAGLLHRFTFNYDTNIVSDEEEKNFVYGSLKIMGARVLPELRNHLHSSPTISWGLRLLDAICDHESSWNLLIEILQKHPPGYTRDPSKKIQLITHIAELADDRVTHALTPYLEDHDETVKFIVINALLKQNKEEARAPLLQLLANEEEDSIRLKTHILEGFIEKEWSVKEHRETIEHYLSDDYLIDGKGRIKRKKGNSAS